jgi:hypothetical protein
VSWALQSLILLFDLEEAEVNIFRGVSPKEDRERLHAGERRDAGGDSPAQGLMLNNPRRTDHGGTRLHVVESDHH